MDKKKAVCEILFIQIKSLPCALCEKKAQIAEQIASQVDLAGDDLQNVLKQIRALKETDGAYQSFSGLKEGESGSVRFIIETDEISK